jgi:hypothetical protein
MFFCINPYAILRLLRFTMLEMFFIFSFLASSPALGRGNCREAKLSGAAANSEVGARQPPCRDERKRRPVMMHEAGKERWVECERYSAGRDGAQ